MPGWWTNARQAQAYSFLASAGLSPYGAAGLVSRWANVESTAAGPSAINPYSKAFGIAQWLGSRKPPIAGNTNFQAQLSYVVQELNGPERRAGSILRAAQTAQEGARGASVYERAEGYNPATGIDNWTAKTKAGIASVLAAARSSVPENIAVNVPAERTPTAEDYESLPRQDFNEAGFSIELVLLVAAGAVAYFFFFND